MVVCGGSGKWGFSVSSSLFGRFREVFLVLGFYVIVVLNLILRRILKIVCFRVYF